MRSKQSAKGTARARELKWVLLIACGFSIGAIIALLWPILIPDRPERVVTVYWTHECACADPWITTLRNADFVVRDFEQETLRFRRAQLHVPRSLRSCHLGTYLGYFLEGHVPPEALRRLAAEHPVAQGVGFVRFSATEPEQLYLISSGRPIAWPAATGE